MLQKNFQLLGSFSIHLRFSLGQKLQLVLDLTINRDITALVKKKKKKEERERENKKDENFQLS